MPGKIQVNETDKPQLIVYITDQDVLSESVNII